MYTQASVEVKYLLEGRNTEHDSHNKEKKYWVIISSSSSSSSSSNIVSCHRPFLPGTSLEAAVIPTAQASSFTLQYFPYYV